MEKPAPSPLCRRLRRCPARRLWWLVQDLVHERLNRSDQLTDDQFGSRLEPISRLQWRDIAGEQFAVHPPVMAAQLKKMVLQPQDLPAAWKGTPYQAQAGQASDDAALSKCVGGRDTQHDKVAEAHSADYTMGNGMISSSATSYRSQSDIDADVEMLHNRKLEGCLEQMVKKDLATSLPAGSKVEAASIKITPGSAGGPSNVVATGTGIVKLSANRQRAAVYLTFAFITGPLIEADVQTETLGAPLPASMLKSLVASVAGRAAKG